MAPINFLVIGLGNPILGDDGVGWIIAQEVEKHICSLRNDIEFDYLSLGGLSLMERLINYKRVIITDSVTSGEIPEGSVITFTLNNMTDLSYGHTTAAHDTSLKTALMAGRKLGAPLPSDNDIQIVAIEIRKVMEIHEGLTPRISAAVPLAVKHVLENFEND